MFSRPKELCQLAGTWKGDVPIPGLLAEVKVDGWRALYLPDHKGKPRLFTRNGHPIEGTGHIVWQLGRMADAAGEPMIFDGEFQVDGALAATKAWCERGWKQGGEAGQFFAFDCMPLREWQGGGSATRLIERKAILRELLAVANDDCWDWRPGSHGRDAEAPPVVVVDDEWAFDTRHVMDLANRVWASGGEGLMLKNAEAAYRRNRSDDWLKVKPGGPWQRRRA